MPGVFDLVSSLLGGGVSKIIDSITAPGEAKTAAKAQLDALTAQATAKAQELDGQLAQAQAGVIMAEAKGDSWLQKSWRPIAALSFVGLLWWCVLTAAAHLPPPNWAAVPDQLWSTIKLCLGGYVGLRSAEKIATGYFNSKGNSNGDGN